MTITKPQIIKIKTVLRKLGLDSEMMALTYSEERTERISLLTFKEASALIKKLGDANNENIGGIAKYVMPRKIISMAHELGWQLPNPENPAKPKADMKRINGWCVNYGFLHKKLNDYTKDELVPLVTQFENMYLKELKKV
jgi:hypothetical protein